MGSGPSLPMPLLPLPRLPTPDSHFPTLIFDCSTFLVRHWTLDIRFSLLPIITEYIPKPVSPPAGPECVLDVFDLHTAARKRNSNHIKAIHVVGAAMAVHPTPRYSHNIALLGPGNGL